MTKNDIFDKLRQLEIPLNVYKQYKEISSIKLHTGREIFQDWLHMRMSFSEDGIKIRYGKSIPYGARLPSPMIFSNDLKYFTAKLDEDRNILVSPNPLTGEIFREPKFGDTIRSSLGCKNILSEAVIIDIKFNQNNKIIYLSQPISNEGKISYFDSSLYTKDGSCDHGETMEGVFMRFYPNQESLSKRETFHELIKYKDITELNVSVENRKRIKI